MKICPYIYAILIFTLIAGCEEIFCADDEYFDLTECKKCDDWNNNSRPGGYRDGEFYCKKPTKNSKPVSNNSSQRPSSFPQGNITYRARCAGIYNGNITAVLNKRYREDEVIDRIPKQNVTIIVEGTKCFPEDFSYDVSAPLGTYKATPIRGLSRHGKICSTYDRDNYPEVQQFCPGEDGYYNYYIYTFIGTLEQANNNDYKKPAQKIIFADDSKLRNRPIIRVASLDFTPNTRDCVLECSVENSPFCQSVEESTVGNAVKELLDLEVYKRPVLSKNLIMEKFGVEVDRCIRSDSFIKDGTISNYGDQCIFEFGIAYEQETIDVALHMDEAVDYKIGFLDGSLHFKEIVDAGNVEIVFSDDDINDEWGGIINGVLSNSEKTVIQTPHGCIALEY